MHIMTKDGQIVEGEPLTEEQLFEIHDLPKILGDYPYLYISGSDKKRLAKYLVEKLDMRKKPDPVVEDEVESVPEVAVEELVYPTPKSLPLVEVPEDDGPLF